MLMNNKSWRWAQAAILVAGGMTVATLSGGTALAYAPESELMKVKGYSPEVIHMADTQRSRQEWKSAAAPLMSPTERFLHNIYYGDWIGDVDEFGSGILREK